MSSVNSNTHLSTSLYTANNKVLQPCKGTCNVTCKSDVVSATLLTMQVVWHVMPRCWANCLRRFWRRHDDPSELLTQRPRTFL